MTSPKLINGEFYWVRFPGCKPFIAEWQEETQNRLGMRDLPCFFVGIYEVMGDPEVLAHIKRPEAASTNELENLRATLSGVEVALARDGDIDGAMRLILAAKV